ncbi:hypothetical protein D3C84_673470 [compost metagenome]
MDADAVFLVLGTDSLKTLRKQSVIERLFGLSIVVQQRNDNRTRAEIRGYKAPDNSGSHDVGLQFFHTCLRPIEGVRHDRATVDTLFRYGHPTNAARPKRLDIRALYTRQKYQLIVDLLQRVQIFRVKNISIVGGNDDSQAIAQSLEIILMGKIVLNVWVIIWDHCLEACIQFQMSRLESQEQCHQQAQKHDQTTMAK